MPSEYNTIKTLGLHEKPLSKNHIKKITPINSDLASWLKSQASEDVFYKKWDTAQDFLDGFWRFSQDITATQFGPPATELLGGVLVGSTGATDNSGLSMRGQPIVKGDTQAWMHAHFKLSAISSIQFEVGLIDAVTDATLPVITDVDTPASGNGGADIAVVHMDTDQTLTTSAFVVDGSTSGMNCVKSNIGTFTPTADTFVCVRIHIDVNDATVIVNNHRNSIYMKTKLANIEGGTMLMPWIYARTRVATNRDIKVDLVELAGERS